MMTDDKVTSISRGHEARVRSRERLENALLRCLCKVDAAIEAAQRVKGVQPADEALESLSHAKDRILASVRSLR